MEESTKASHVTAIVRVGDLRTAVEQQSKNFTRSAGTGARMIELRFGPFTIYVVGKRNDRHRCIDVRAEMVNRTAPPVHCDPAALLELLTCFDNSDTIHLRILTDGDAQPDFIARKLFSDYVVTVVSKATE